MNKVLADPRLVCTGVTKIQKVSTDGRAARKLHWVQPRFGLVGREWLSDLNTTGVPSQRLGLHVSFSEEFFHFAELDFRK